MKKVDSDFKQEEYSVKPIMTCETKDWLLHKHYAHRLPSITYAFGLYHGEILIGICTYGHPFSSQLKKCMGDEWFDKIMELNRLCVNEGLPQNALSWFVAQTFKLLPKPMPLVSYADTAHNHHGYIYQATIWIYTGISAPFMDYVVKGYEHLHNQSVCDLVGRADKDDEVGGKSRYQLLVDKFGAENVYKVERSQKHRYFYMLGNKRDKKRMMKSLTYEVMPYPKGDNVRYDASYNPTIQLTLF